jgi:hypothetical protein
MKRCFQNHVSVTFFICFAPTCHNVVNILTVLHTICVNFCRRWKICNNLEVNTTRIGNWPPVWSTQSFQIHCLRFYFRCWSRCSVFTNTIYCYKLMNSGDRNTFVFSSIQLKYTPKNVPAQLINRPFPWISQISTSSGWIIQYKFRYSVVSHFLNVCHPFLKTILYLSV